MTNLVTIKEDDIYYQTIDRFWETYPRVWDRIRGNVRLIAMAHFDVSVEQFQILRHIRKGSGSVSELAVVKGISRSAISQAVDVLVEKGLISRQQNAKDRRYVELTLTQNGNALLSAIFEKNRRWMMEKLAILCPEEAASIIRGIEALQKAFD
jgi:DNA-binding MarR family transcriptional regulator